MIGLDGAWNVLLTYKVRTEQHERIWRTWDVT
jgi:hypothetical protein